MFRILTVPAGRRMPEVDDEQLQIAAQCRNCCGVFVFLLQSGQWVDEKQYQLIISGKAVIPADRELGADKV